MTEQSDPNGEEAAVLRERSNEAMPSKTETAARRLVAELYRATDGRLMQMRSLQQVAGRAGADAETIYHAAKRGRVEVSPENDPHSIALTHARQQLASSTYS